MSKKQRFVIKPDMQNWQEMSTHIGILHQQGKTATVEVIEGEVKQRSLSANNLQAVWIAEIANWQGHTEKHVRNYVKAELALPILLEDEDSEIAKKIRYTLDKIGYDLMSPAQRIEVMDMFNVTSILKTKQHNKFREQMQKHYSDAGLELIVR